MNKIFTYIEAVSISISQMANAVFLFGDPDETISGRAYRRGTLDGEIRWKKAGKFINKIFFLQYNHIQDSYDFDIERAKRVIAKHEGRGV